MKLYLKGHSYQYAVEQMLLTLFPDERPLYPDGKPEGDRMEISLHRGESYTTASCLLTRGGERRRGTARALNREMTDELVSERICQRLIKNAMYRAALAAGHEHPAWGALTGVRPGKVFSSLLKSGMDEDEALRHFIRDYDVTPPRAALCRDTTRHTLAAVRALEKKDVCLYLGVPFCPTRCAYCSFVSQSVEKSMKLIAPFVDALEREIDAVGEQVARLGLRPVAVYFGGGTPTTLSAEQLDRVCGRMEKSFDLSSVREFTVEAGRPDTITEEKLRVLRAHGCDRISVNPQSMSDAVLEAIGRRHTAADIVTALEKVRAVGGFSVNMDPDAVAVGRMLDFAESSLRAQGYEPYYLYRQKFMSGGFENVGWTKPGFVNLYNICIMEELCSILAMGAGGSTKLIRHDGGRNLRFIAPKYPLEYIGGIGGVCDEKKKIEAFYRQWEE